MTTQTMFPGKDALVRACRHQTEVTARETREARTVRGAMSSASVSGESARSPHSPPALPQPLRRDEPRRTFATTPGSGSGGCDPRQPRALT